MDDDDEDEDDADDDSVDDNGRDTGEGGQLSVDEGLFNFVAENQCNFLFTNP